MGILYDLKNLFKREPPPFQAMEPQCVRYEFAAAKSGGAAAASTSGWSESACIIARRDFRR